ncbi:MAG: ACP S-malonyltransferase [Alphaproteobacteria bacterium]|nr:ACP S-malonyltransferase [Alphaproteobacteria bacterium]
MMRAFVFPGQGSQAVGMGRDLAGAFPAARRLFDEVDDALSQSLSRLMFEGPESKLTLTENAQPALMAASLAVLRVLEVELGLDVRRDIAYVAGHSLGEYSALAAVRSLAVGDAARLLKLRGEAMQRAVPVGEGAMAALIGLDAETAKIVALKATCAGVDHDEVCAVANDNGPGQAVVSGHRSAVERAVAIAREHGARRSVMLPVSAPFHSPLLAPAADVMAAALAKVTLSRPLVPVIANVTAHPVHDPDDIGELLVRQVTEMVRWRETVLFLANSGIDEVIEVGTGRVLTGLVKRTAPDVVARALGTPADIAALHLLA